MSIFEAFGEGPGPQNFVKREDILQNPENRAMQLRTFKKSALDRILERFLVQVGLQSGAKFHIKGYWKNDEKNDDQDGEKVGYWWLRLHSAPRFWSQGRR